LDFGFWIRSAMRKYCQRLYAAQRLYGSTLKRAPDPIRARRDCDDDHPDWIAPRHILWVMSAKGLLVTQHISISVLAAIFPIGGALIAGRIAAERFIESLLKRIALVVLGDFLLSDLISYRSDPTAVP
jgi:hypothetical protein